MKVKTSVDDKQVKEAFNRLSKLAPQKARGAVKRSALAVLREAKENCPVDQGDLRVRLTTKEYENWLSADVGTNLSYACIFNCMTSITTSKGPKTIGQIEVGDLVLTQTGDYKAVIAKRLFPAKEKPDLIEIEAYWRKDRNHKLIVTEDHKILAYREGRNIWIKAGELKLTDRLYMAKKIPYNLNSGVVKICQHCGKEYRKYEGQGKKYCSMACRTADYASGNNPHLGMKRSVESSKRMSESKQLYLKKHPEGHINRILSQRGYETDFEKKVEAWLILRGVEYKKQVYVNKHYADFYVPAEKTIYEADGSFWHQDQKKDIERDQEIKKEMADAKIIHIHFYDKRFSPELDANPMPGVYYMACNPGPDSYVNPNRLITTNILSIKHLKYGTKKHKNDPCRASLYDLTIEDIHSFFANGILVSNSYIEYGTGPAAGHGRYFPPPGVLLRWMHLHGIPEEAEYAIRRKLFLQGTKPRPFLFPAWERERPEFISKIRNALKDATGEASKGG